MSRDRHRIDAETVPRSPSLQRDVRAGSVAARRQRCVRSERLRFAGRIGVRKPTDRKRRAGLPLRTGEQRQQQLSAKLSLDGAEALSVDGVYRGGDTENPLGLTVSIPGLPPRSGQCVPAARRRASFRCAARQTDPGRNFRKTQDRRGASLRRNTGAGAYDRYDFRVWERKKL